MAMKFGPDDLAVEIQYLSKKLGEHLAGRRPEVQSGALADCCAMYLAGYRVPGDTEGTDKLRAEMFQLLIALIAELVEPNAKEIDSR